MGDPYDTACRSLDFSPPGRIRTPEFFPLQPIAGKRPLHGYLPSPLGSPLGSPRLSSASASPQSGSESSGSESSGSNQQLKDEVIRLRAKVAGFERKRRTRARFKPGSPQVRYVMRTLQTCHNTYTAQLRKEHAERASGYAARLLLARLLKNFMVQLDEESNYEGFDWKAVIDRPHAKALEFIVD